MHQARFSIHADMGLHAEIPLAPFFDWRISGSRSALLYLVELGAAMSVASTTVPVGSNSPSRAVNR
jgi:hypothetical protein